jgi:Spy/CpxP family protein refolding chaperone
MKPMRMVFVFAGILMAGTALLAAISTLSIAADDTSSSSTAAAPSGPHGWGHGPGGDGPGREGPGREGPGHLFSKLGLSTEQQASIKGIMTAAKPQMKSMHDQMRANHQKLMQTKPDDPNYANVVAEVAQSNAALASQRTSHAAELRTQMYAVLTPAQKTQLTALEAQWAENPHHGRWQHGPPGAQPGAQ